MATVTPFPTAPVPPAGVALDVWTQALDAASATAQTAMPDAGERLARALALVRAGAVAHAAQWGVYHYTVASESDPTGLQTYDVHAQAPLSCTCTAWTQQAKKGKGVSCKHLLATWLYRRALAQVSPPLADPATAPQTRQNTRENAAEIPLPEAAFSITLKGTMRGHEVLLTARGQTWEAFRANLEHLRGLLDPAPEQAIRPAVAAPEQEPTCKYHGKMKASTKAPGTFFCTRKLADGSYCTSRFPEK